MSKMGNSRTRLQLPGRCTGPKTIRQTAWTLVGCVTLTGIEGEGSAQMDGESLERKARAFYRPSIAALVTGAPSASTRIFPCRLASRTRPGYGWATELEANSRRFQ